MSEITIQTISNIIEVFVETPYNRQAVTETLEVIKNYLQECEVTAYVQEKAVVSRIASTLSDPDETQCLDNIVMKIPEVSDMVHLEEGREGVTDTVLIPLTYGGLAAWLIYEKYHGQIRTFTKEENMMFWVFGICLTSYMRNKAMRRNFYIESLTGLPGQEYFLLSMDKIRAGCVSQWVLVTRITAYESQVQILGIKSWNKMIAEVGDLLRRHCKTYHILNDTFATELSGSKAEAFDLVIRFKEEIASRYDVKMLLLDVAQCEDLMAAIEREMVNCRQGNVLVPSSEKNCVFDIFKEKTKKYQKPAMAQKILDETDLDLFDLL